MTRALPRAFLAVDLAADVATALEAHLRPLRGRADVRWVAPEQWHVTLRFCGRVPDVDRLVEAVRAEVAGLPPVEGLRLVGAGAFPSPRRATVLWVGMGDADAVAALGALAARLERACVAIGLAPDDRAFRPHVTVARVSRARDLRAVVAAAGGAPIGGPWTVGEVRLLASDTRPTGAVHHEVARFPLGG